MHQNKYYGAKTSRKVIGADLRNKLLYMAVILAIPVITFAYPFKFETCNLGWQHVHHDHNEESYQQAWCNAHNGIMEYENEDYTRVDCLNYVPEETEETTKKKAKAKKDTETVKRARGGRTIDF